MSELKSVLKKHSIITVLLVNTSVNSTQNDNVSNLEGHHNLDLSTIPRLSTRNPTVEDGPVHTVVENEDSQQHTGAVDGVAAEGPHVCPCGKSCSRYEFLVYHTWFLM